MTAELITVDDQKAAEMVEAFKPLAITAVAAKRDFRQFVEKVKVGDEVGVFNYRNRSGGVVRKIIRITKRLIVVESLGGVAMQYDHDGFYKGHSSLRLLTMDELTEKRGEQAREREIRQNISLFRQLVDSIVRDNLNGVPAVPTAQQKKEIIDALNAI